MFKHFKTVSTGLTRKRKWQRDSVRLIQTSEQDVKKPKMKPCPKTGSGRGFYKTIGAVILGTGAVVVLAKNNDEFRDWLKDNVPGSDEFISFVAAEKTTRIDYIMRKMEDFGKEEKIDEDSPLGKVFAAISSALIWLASFVEEESVQTKPPLTKPPSDEEGQPYNPKKAVEKRMKQIDEDKKAEADERKKELEELEAIELAKKKKAQSDQKTDEGPAKKPKAEIQKEVLDNVEAATQAYVDGICFLKQYTDTVKVTVESSVEKQDPKIWPELRNKTTKTDAKVKKLLEDASKAEFQAQRSFKELNDPKRLDKLTNEEKTEHESKFKHLKNMREEFIRQKNMANVTNTYWTLVKQAREHFQEQLSTLFPDLSSVDKSMKLAEAEMDLFILYAFQTILHYQKELNKLDMMSKTNLKAALERSKIGDPELIECVIEQELNKEREKICEEYKKKLQDLKADCEKKANEAIEKHNEMHTEMLQEALARKEEEVTKKMKRQLNEHFIQETQKYREEMAEMLGRLKGMDELMMKRASQEKQAVDSMLLWSACEGLVSAITCERDCAAVSTRSLGPEIRAIQLAASRDDVLVQAVVKAIPQIAYDRGIFGEPALKERFTNTSRIARRVALLPEGGASLPLMFISYLQSVLVASPTPPMSCSELAEQHINPQSLNTFEILQLAKYWMDRGDWYQVLRYMNLMKGASRVVAQDFLDEVKIFLETKQAADVLIAHASVSAIAT